jgi:photosystem II stability/assembly factor-like uncharacterized protein
MNKHSLSGWWAAVAVSGLLAACGGGSDGPPPPTAIPENLTISAPGAAESNTALRFSNSAGALSGLKYSWDFGDGGTSTEAAPDHSFASGGEFEVTLKVTNEVGANREVRGKVTITNIANVRGLVCSGADSTGWCWQNPRPTGNRVNTVFFLDASVGWRAGDMGEIFKTTDAGSTWVKQASGISTTIQGIAFLDARTGWATGAFGAVLKTVDGGVTWKVDKIPNATGVFYDASVITVIDANTVYVGRTTATSGGYGAVFVSTDAGASWRLTTPAPAVITQGGKLWAVEGNVVRRSVDGGKSFAAVLNLNPASNTYFDSISLTARDELRAAVLASKSGYDFATQQYVSKYVVSTTQDGGASWLTVDGTGLNTYGTYLRLLSVSEDGKALNALSYSNVLLRSVDGGQTWSSPGAIDPMNPYGLAITAFNADVLGAIGFGGAFLSEDGGLNWLKLKLPAVALAPPT